MLNSLDVDEARGQPRGPMEYVDEARQTDGANLPPDDAAVADVDGEDFDEEQARSESEPH